MKLEDKQIFFKKFSTMKVGEVLELLPLFPQLSKENVVAVLDRVIGEPGLEQYQFSLYWHGLLVGQGAANRQGDNGIFISSEA